VIDPEHLEVDCAAAMLADSPVTTCSESPLGIANSAPGLGPGVVGRTKELQSLRQEKPVAIRWLIGLCGSGKANRVPCESNRFALFLRPSAFRQKHSPDRASCHGLF
jgi:hypothetical protein